MPNRDEQIEQMYRSGMAMREIGKTFSLTRSRVQQILAERGVPSRPSIPSGLLSRYGCGRKTWEMLVRNGVTEAFWRKRQNVLRVGGEWRMTLMEFWSIWSNSGHWNDRGRGQENYCMTRIDPHGPWTADNVEIVTKKESSSRTMRRYWGMIQESVLAFDQP